MRIKKFDIITWVKDGAWVLPTTLKRLENVLPNEKVHRKIMIDDASNDETKAIGKEFNWEVYSNPGSGISSAANYALSKVDCPFFMSFEQDLFLAKDWWEKISPLLTKDKVAAASGARLVYQPTYMKKLEEYMFENKIDNSSWDHPSFGYGKFLDNTLWNTQNIKQWGGFPNLKYGSGVDAVMSFLVFSKGSKWIVNKRVASLHIRKDTIKHQLEHQYWYAYGLKEIKQKIREETNLILRENYLSIMSRLVFSPFRAFQIATKKRDARICYIYPLMRLYYLAGYLAGQKN